MPCPKIANPKEFNDLVPVSILPVLFKVLEQAVQQKLKLHINSYNLLAEVQSKIRRNNHSYITALGKLTDDILPAPDRDLITILR
ncbi:hypothetical protein Trydic_g18706 [Trypoxylus dichotomus]